MPSGTLYLVATPIGNLEDITLRALRVLREVSVIAAEDTRRTRKLLTHFGISTPTVSFHQHNASQRAPALIGRLNGGESIAVVADAGTPGISDPGLELLQRALAEGVPCDALPGASAPITAAILSGFPLDSLLFIGFMPHRSNDRSKVIGRISESLHTVVLFESPRRIRRTLAEIGISLGDRPICVARELTKVHQEILRGTAHEVAGQLTSEKGEFTLVIGPPPKYLLSNDLHATSDSVGDEFRQLTEDGRLTRREIIRALAAKYGCRPREIYALLEQTRPVGQST
jgi:16S rRNA (cytidine1402-2'-O)-methyltransferase